MGIGRQIIEAVIREHLYRPVDGDVLMMGRQTVYLTPQDLLGVFRDHGIDINDVDPASIEIDRSTIDHLPGWEDRPLVTDRALFKLMGSRKVLALDHSEYEGADIVHDLRYPVPSKLCGIADFIVDGSTLDNVFTPSTVLKNYCDMLRPNGRLIALNAFSHHDTPYVIMPPMWYVDYFVMNGFADCKVYIFVFDTNGKWNTFYVDMEYLLKAGRTMGRFRCPYHAITLVFAEKGRNSTSDQLPIQQDYRPAQDWKTFNHNLTAIVESRRHHLARSYVEQFFMDVIGGHVFIDGQYIGHY